MNRMTCPHCGKKFMYERIRNIDNHEKRAMPIVCPYCDHVAAEQLTHGYFVTTRIENYLDKK